jgi:hypothetical protein
VIFFSNVEILPEILLVFNLFLLPGTLLLSASYKLMEIDRAYILTLAEVSRSDGGG